MNNYSKPTTNINGVKIHIPQNFDGIVPVSPHEDMFFYEPFAFLGISESINPGDIVFDLGVSYGVMTTCFAAMVGPAGHVHSFEANTSILPMIHQLIAENGFTDRVTLNNNLVTNVSDIEESFYVVEGFSSVASSANPEVMKIGGVPHTVKTIKLDDYCNIHHVVPNFIKIDIEGAEYVAVDGMSNLLKKHLPILQIEVHGKEISGIGGNLKLLLKTLENYGYHLYDLERGRLTDCLDYLSSHSECTGYLLAQSSFSDEQLNRLQNKYQTIQSYLSKIRENERKLAEARKFIQQNNLKYAKDALCEMISEGDAPAEAHYLYAFAVHCGTKPDVLQAYIHYTIALEKGFDEFWVRYNRGALLMRSGYRSDARRDVIRAYELNSQHEGVLNLVSALKED